MADVLVEVEGQRMKLSNLDKVLYPESGFTKAEVIDYYTRIAPVVLPHLRDRPATRKRYPDGVDAEPFFEKNAPSHTPAWVRTEQLPTPGSTLGRDTANFVVVDDLPTLVWCANLAALELHIPQWRVTPDGGRGDADLVVFDLDPGPPATVVECCRVALWLRDALAGDGLEAWPKTSGRKGMQLYVPVRDTPAERTSAYAKRLAEKLERAHAELVVSRMAKKLRGGKVFIDWSQNNAAKTTVAPYSLRAAPEPTVSTPIAWDEVEACREVSDLRFLAGDVLARADEDGDLFEPLLASRRPPLP
ncbi:MAG: non-homologous end-joining DNA ligase [Streptosporangiales bacterium]|nr:non-homologous end-joining DNA ligase [Streptosporangiales bacterium]